MCVHCNIRHFLLKYLFCWKSLLCFEKLRTLVLGMPHPALCSHLEDLAACKGSDFLPAGAQHQKWCTYIWHYIPLHWSIWMHPTGNQDGIHEQWIITSTLPLPLIYLHVKWWPVLYLFTLLASFYTPSLASSFNKTVLSRVTSTVSLAQALALSFIHICHIHPLHLADFALMMKPGGFHLRCWQHRSPPCHLSEIGLASPLKLSKRSIPTFLWLGLRASGFLTAKLHQPKHNACIRTYSWVSLGQNKKWGGKRDNCGW